MTEQTLTVMQIILWAARFSTKLALIAPLFVPGILLAELFSTGSMDDQSEFCDEVEKPSFVFGAAKTCELDLPLVAKVFGLSYAFGFSILLPVFLFGALVSMAIDRERR